MKNVLVTFDLWKEGQEILEKELGPLARISYLKKIILKLGDFISPITYFLCIPEILWLF